MSLYKEEDCFFISSFLAGKEANGAVAVDKSGQKIERGKNQCPGAGRRGRRKQGPESAAATGALSTSDGGKQRGRSTEENTRGRRHEKGIKRGWAGQRAQPAPLGRPRSVGYLLRFSSGGGTEGTARAKSERRIKARGFTRGRKLAGYRNLGRKRKRLQAAHHRARVDICRQSFRFPSGFWFGGGVEGAGRDFGIKISWGMSLSGFMFFIK